MTLSQTRYLRWAPALLALAGLSLGAEEAKPKDTWQFEVTPYFWASGMEGSASVNGVPQAGLGVTQSPSDILDNLEMGFMATFEARKGRWGVLLDVIYFGEGAKGSVTGERGLATLTADGDFSQGMYALAASYRTTQGPASVDMLGGLRYVPIEWDVTVQASSPILPASQRQFTEKKSWVDPYLGVKADYRLGDRWGLMGYLDVGGFGIGTEISAQALVGASYAFTPAIVGKAGVRYIYSNYDQDDFTWDMTNLGGYLGVGFRW